MFNTFACLLRRFVSRMRNHVASQLRFQPKRFVTTVTFVRRIHLMLLQMFQQVTLLRKSTATNLTLVRLDVQMDHFMTVQVAFHLEGLLAEATFEIFLRYVELHVHSQGISSVEGFSASLANVGFFAGVRLNVSA